MFRPARATAAFVVTLAILIAGCGGDDPAPTRKEDFIARVDKLCLRDDALTAKAAGEFQKAIGDGDYDAAAQVVLGLQSDESAIYDQIEELDPPEAGQATIDEFLSLSRQMSDLDTDIAEAVRNQDHEADAAAKRQGDLLENRRDRLAGRYGFKQCAADQPDQGQ